MNERVIETYKIQNFIPGNKIKIKSSQTKYHYTSPEGLLSIIKNSGLYFTDIRYFNDKSENTYIFKCIKDFLNNNPNEYNVLRETIDDIFPNSDSQDACEWIPEFPFADSNNRVFVLCTCTDPDSLCMWNYYVKNGNYKGYNIGLNPTKIVESIIKGSKDINVLIGNVIYDEEDQEKQIKSIADYLETYFADEDDKEKRLAVMCSYFHAFSPFFKNGKFKHEREFRFVISIDENKLSSFKSDALELDFRISNGIVVPYLSLSFDKKALTKVCLSPNTEKVISSSSIKELCKECGYGDIHVDASNIPIRF